MLYGFVKVAWSRATRTQAGATTAHSTEPGGRTCRCRRSTSCLYPRTKSICRGQDMQLPQRTLSLHNKVGAARSCNVCNRCSSVTVEVLPKPSCYGTPGTAMLTVPMSATRQSGTDDGTAGGTQCISLHWTITPYSTSPHKEPCQLQWCSSFTASTPFEAHHHVHRDVTMLSSTVLAQQS